MLSLFIKATSPIFIFLGLILLYAYATGQNAHELINSLISQINIIIQATIDIFNRH